jgi:hypothetical protein
LLERLDQRLRRERLCKVGDTPGFQGSHANRMAVICGDVDDRNGNSRGLEAVPRVDPGLIIQVDVGKSRKAQLLTFRESHELCR